MNKVIDKGFRSCRFVSTIVKHPVLSKSDIKTVLEMYGAAKRVIVTAIFNSNKAKL